MRRITSTIVFGTTRVLSRVMAAAAIAALMAGTSQAEEVVLKTQTTLPTQHALSQSYIKHFITRLNEAGKGVVQVDLLGGPEVNPRDRAPQAMQRGIIDILWIPAAYLSGIVPQAQAMMLQNVGIEELRKNGAFDVFRPFYQERLNAHLLAWSETGDHSGYYLYTNKKPKMKDGIVDLTGLSLRTTGAYRPIQEALNATTVQVPAGDVPTAMDRGVIDGFGWPTVGLQSIGLETVAKFRIEPSFYHLANVVLVNKDRWDGLSEDARALITRVAQEYELASVEEIKARNLDDVAAADAAGVEAITMQGDAADRYLSIAFEAMWGRVEGKVGADEVARLRKYLYR